MHCWCNFKYTRAHREAHTLIQLSLSFPHKACRLGRTTYWFFGFIYTVLKLYVIYKPNSHVPLLPCAENMCQYHHDTSICCYESKSVSKGTSLHFVNLYIIDSLFQTDPRNPCYSSEITWSPRFFLQGVSVHRKVGEKPEITGIFIKCNNWTLC